MSNLHRSVSVPILAAAVACLAPFAAAFAKPAPPRPITLPEHHRNASAREVHTTYTCRDGRRSNIVQYDHILKGRIARLSRNGRNAPPAVVARVNALLRYLDYLSAVYPQCGSKDDIFAASGMKDNRHAAIIVRWSLTEAVMVQIAE